MRNRLLLLLACGALAGCPDGKPKPAAPGEPARTSVPEGPGDAPGVKGALTPIVRTPVRLAEVAAVGVEPSSTDQTTVCQDRLKVTIPGGLLTEKTTLTVSVPAEPQPAPSPRLAPIGDFDVKLGDRREFAKELTLAFAFDPAKLEPGTPAGMQIVAACWDEMREQWRRVPFAVDLEAKTVAIRTTHLSRWAVWYENVRGFKCTDAYAVRGAGGFNWVVDRNGEGRIGGEIWFRVYYDPEADAPIALHLRPGQGVPVRPSVLVRDILTSAYVKYAAASFDMPTGTFDVFIDPSLKGAAAADMKGIDNIIYIPGPGTWESPAEVRQNVAHELFHTVQNQTLNAPISMTLRKWWMEATADYAAAKIAFADDPAVWDYTVRFVKPWFPEKGLEYFKDVDVGETGSSKESDDLATKEDPFQKHQYHTCVFVDYMVRHIESDRKQQPRAFHDLWMGAAKGWIFTAHSHRVLEAIDAYLTAKIGRTLPDVYEWFAIHWYMLQGECASPMTKKGRVPVPLRKNAVVVPAGGDTASVHIELDGGYCSTLASVTSPGDKDGGRLFSINCDGLPEHGAVFVFCPLSDNRTPGPGELPEPSDGSAQLTPGKPAYFMLGDSPLYVLAVNTGTQALVFSVELLETTCRIEPDGKHVKEGEGIVFHAVLNHPIPNAEYAWYLNDNEQEGSGPEFTHWFKEAGLFAERVSVVVRDSTNDRRIVGAETSVHVEKK
ncbi:MAG: PKD domain-containing protein [Planctomycetes bacterium]|nr:PKD domain-containing protein [Planctomycetota bacterium]